MKKEIHILTIRLSFWMQCTVRFLNFSISDENKLLILIVCKRLWKKIFKRYVHKCFFQHYYPCRCLTTPFSPSSPFSAFLSFSFPLLETLEKSRRESRLHQLRHNVTHDFEWAASLSLSSLASTGHYAARSYVSRRRVRAGIDLCPRAKTRGGCCRSRNTLLMLFCHCKAAVSRAVENTEVC